MKKHYMSPAFNVIRVTDALLETYSVQGNTGLRITDDNGQTIRGRKGLWDDDDDDEF